MNRPVRIRYLGPNPAQARETAATLETQEPRFQVETCPDARSALDGLTAATDCLVTAADLPDGDGIAVAETANEAFPELGIIFFPESGSEHLASRAVAAGVTAYVPATPATDRIERLVGTIEEVVADYPTDQYLRGERQFVDRIVNALDEVFYVIDEAGRMRRWNEQVSEITGYTSGEIASMEAVEFFPAEQRSRVEGAIEEALETGSVLVEAEIETTGGEHIPYEFTGARLEEFEETLVGVVGTGRDISERRRREAALERKERRYEAVFEDPNVLTVLVDTDGTTLDVNQTALNVLDGDEADLLGERFWEIPLFAGERELQRRCRGAIELATGGEYVEFEVDFTDALGTAFVVSGTARPVTDTDGAVRSVLLSARDITERIDRQRTLEQYEHVVDNVEDLIFLVNEDRCLELANEAVATLPAGGDGARPGRPVASLVAELTTADDGVERFELALETAFDRDEGDPQVSVELESVLSTGLRAIDYQFASLAVGEEEFVVVLGRDVTDRKQREKQLTVLDRVLRHNFRNELNVIRGWGETLQTSVSGEQASYADRIVQTSDRLIGTVEKERLITAILTQEPDHRTLDLRPFIERIGTVVSEDFPEAHLALECPEGVTVRATTELDRALGELFDNAIEHSTASTPQLDVSVTVEENVARIDVADNGPLIPEMEQAVLTGAGEETPLYHGSGLGLWLVNMIATRSGGRVLYRENEPRGNVVGLVLPLARGG